MESWLKEGILSQKLSILKYFLKCKKLWLLPFILFTFVYVGFSLPTHVYLAFSQTVPTTAGDKYLV